jgi:hypothetical protein
VNEPWTIDEPPKGCGRPPKWRRPASRCANLIGAATTSGCRLCGAKNVTQRRRAGRAPGGTQDRPDLCLAVQSSSASIQPDFGMLFADMCLADGEEVAWTAGCCSPRSRRKSRWCSSAPSPRPAHGGRHDSAPPLMHCLRSRWSAAASPTGTSSWVDTIADNASSGCSCWVRGR